MSGVANNVGGSTIFTGNTVQGGANDVTVNNELVEGDLTVNGTLDIGLAVFQGVDVEGSAEIKGDLTVGDPTSTPPIVSNIVATGNISCETLTTSGVAQFNTNVTAGGNIGADSMTVTSSSTIKNLLVNDTTAEYAASITGNVNVDGDIHCTGDILADGDIIGNGGLIAGTSITTNANTTITNAGAVLGSITTPALMATGSYIVAIDNVSVDLNYNSTSLMFGKSGTSQRQTTLGLVQSPWNNIVDSRFSTWNYQQYTWNLSYNGSAWVQNTVTSPVIDSFSTLATLQAGTTYDLIAITDTTANVTIEDLNGTAEMTYEMLGDFNSSTTYVRTANPLAFRYEVGAQIAVGNYVGSGYNFRTIQARSIETYDSTQYVVYSFTYNGSTDPGTWSPVTIYSANNAILTGSVNGNITATVSVANATTVSRVVDVGKTLSLAAGVLTSSATIGVDTIQNVDATLSFAVGSVAQLNNGFTTDRRQAVLNANAPTGANPFATITDIIAGGGSYAPGGTATGAIQTRSSIGTFTADDDYTYDPATKRQRITSAGSTLDSQPSAITLTSATAGGSTNPMLKMENTNAAAGSVFIETYKNKNGVAGEVVGNWSSFGKNASGSKREFSRISTAIRQATAGLEDGSVSIFVMRDNIVSEYARFNGLDGEIEFFRGLDMNSNAVTNATSISGPTGTGIGSTATMTEYRVKDATTGNISGITFNDSNSTVAIGGYIQPGSGIRDSAGSVGSDNFLRCDSSGLLQWSNPPVPSYSGANGIAVDNVNTLISIVNTNTGISFLDATSVPAPITGISSVSAKVFQSTDELGYFDFGTITTSATSGSNTGLHLPVRIGGTQYKIRLESD
jgi:cytoskeletal protein CcmA (bactofilin family)